MSWMKNKREHIFGRFPVRNIMDAIGLDPYDDILEKEPHLFTTVNHNFEFTARVVTDYVAKKCELSIAPIELQSGDPLSNPIDTLLSVLKNGVEQGAIIMELDSTHNEIGLVKLSSLLCRDEADVDHDWEDVKKEYVLSLTTGISMKKELSTYPCYDERLRISYEADWILDEMFEKLTGYTDREMIDKCLKSAGLMKPESKRYLDIDSGFMKNRPGWSKMDYIDHDHKFASESDRRLETMTILRLRAIEQYETNPVYCAPQKGKSKTKRKTIPKAIREQTWEKYCGEKYIAPCYCCGRDIRVTNWEASHVLPACFNGPDTVENLRPCCKACNSGMSSMHMHQYIKLHEPKRAKELNL